MIIGGVQHDVIWEDAVATHGVVEPLIAEAVDAGAELVVLTEMFSTGFTSDPQRQAQGPDGSSVMFLSEQAQRFGITLMASLPWRLADGSGFTNRLVMVTSRGVTAHYDKIHPFSYGHESDHYLSGANTITVDVGPVRVTPFVCYDLRFAPEMWRVALTTDCYVMVANWPAGRRHHWRSLVVARAIENQAYVVAVNRVGSGGGLDYAGDSMIVDPLGEILADGGDCAGVIAAEVSADTVANVRRTFPFLQDRTS